MVWNSENDELLCREVLVVGPYQYKTRNREQENVWKQVADAFNITIIENKFFRVVALAVRRGVLYLSIIMLQRRRVS